MTDVADNGRMRPLVCITIAAVSFLGACAKDTAKSGGTVAYANCTEVKAAGKAPLHKGDAGYSTKLDRDGDGIACDN